MSIWISTVNVKIEGGSLYGVTATKKFTSFEELTNEFPFLKGLPEYDKGNETITITLRKAMV